MTDTDTLVTPAEEAVLARVSRRSVSRARHDPTHPSQGPHAVRVGDRVGAPAGLVVEWWAGRRRGPGRPRTGPPHPPGLTRGQWAALRRHAAGTVLSPRMVRALTVGGWLDDTGGLTGRARDALAWQTNTGEDA